MKYLFLYILILIPTITTAQKFEGNVLAGFQMSDLKGVETFGYHVGLQGLYKINQQWSAGIEILATQNGDYSNQFPRGLNFDKVRLNFVEIPVQVVYAFAKTTEEDFYRIRFYGGATYAHLYQYEIFIQDIGAITETIDLPNSTILPHFGVVGFFTPRLGLDFKSTLNLDGEFTLAFRALFLI